MGKTIKKQELQARLEQVTNLLENLYEEAITSSKEEMKGEINHSFMVGYMKSGIKECVEYLKK